jgi:hypothetical protein
MDYNRFMYARGNPMKFTDPSGHCATLDNGDPDWNSDEECWQLAYEIYGFSSRESFARDWKITGDEWLEKIAKARFADVEYLKPFAEQYRTEWAREMGLPVDKVVWHEPPLGYGRWGEPEIIGFILGERTVCETWDCVAIGMNISSMGVQIARDIGYLSSPLTGPIGLLGGTTGSAAQNTLAITSVGWTVYQAQQGNSSSIDLAVTGVTTVVSYVPVAGEFATGVQLAWDIFDPFHPW